VTTRLVLAAIAALVASTGLYAALRVLQFFVFPDPNPALVVWSAHAGYFWRVATVAYLGGMAGIVAFWLTAHDAARVARVLARAVPFVAAVLAAQGALFP
jgi:hypothetical protein